MDRTFEILIVEDNPGDARLIQEGLRNCQLSSNTTVTECGARALAFLNKEDGFKKAPTPDFIILDLNLPRLSGFQVLAKLKQNEIWRDIPVAIFTTSELEDDIHRSYELQANCYVTKPTGIDEFLDVVKSVTTYWLSTTGENDSRELPG
ncbi:MAG: response regulator [Candidatus Neomarinimicrobiota bacterium]